MLAGSLLYLVLQFGLLAALLSLCIAYLLSDWLDINFLSKRLGKYSTKTSAVIVGLLPFIGFLLLGLGASSAIGGLQDEFQGLYGKLLSMLETWRKLLPANFADKLPDSAEAGDLVINSLKERAGAIAAIGKTWLVGVLQIIVGTIIGVLIYVDSKKESDHSEAGTSIATRAKNFIENFRNIITAQFVIAIVNAVMTAIYLFAVLPFFDVHMPYATALTVLTFVASMLPIVGNLFTNTVLTLVSLSVSPLIAVASLTFLVLVHKSEFIINAWVVGGKTSTAVWEMLLAIFICETLFGVAGIVAGPLYYAYLKQEIKENFSRAGGTFKESTLLDRESSQMA